MTSVSVAIPLGPNPAYREWLPECVASVVNQIYDGDINIVLIDDQANVTEDEFEALVKEVGELSNRRGFADVGDPDYYHADWDNGGADINRRLYMYRTWWNVGVADAFNFGVALAPDELVFMLGSDDKMLPKCIKHCVRTWEKNDRKDAWYAVTIQYQSGQKQDIPCNTAMVTQRLWKYLGGFPPSAGVGACDAILLSILMVHAPDRIIRVREGEPLCWLREHATQDTQVNGWLFAREVVDIRNKETLRFVPKAELT